MKTIIYAAALTLLASVAFSAVDGDIPNKNASNVRTQQTKSTSKQLKNPAIISGIDIIPTRSGITVTKGRCKIGGKIVTVKSDTYLPVANAEAVTVADEETFVLTTNPESFWNGTRLKGPDGNDTNAQFAYNPNTVILRKKPSGKPLILGKDYLVSDEFGMLGLTENSSVSSKDKLYVSYSYSLIRIDSIEITPAGKVLLKKGKSDVSTPKEPALSTASLRLANIFIPYRSTSVKPNDIFPIIETVDMVKTRSCAGLIPNTIAKLKSGKKVKIVCWGDSVTVGGNASTADKIYPEVFKQMLRKKYSNTDFANISVGGSSSINWLYPDKHPFSVNGKCDFERVAAEKPDLVTIEFVNDTGFDKTTFDSTYNDILKRIKALDAECILITPHFTTPVWMGFDDIKGKENRTYVQYLNEFAKKNNLAVADASSRWEHLWLEGIPYTTLLDNTLNHPDDMGHRIFAEELMKCF